MEYRIKDAADAAGVSVRTLHHYDRIGLLCPEKTDANGYRKYTDADLQKLQQVMFFKELDFSLSEIRMIIDDPDFNRLEAMQNHIKLLLKKKKRLDSIIDSLEKTIESIKEDRKMTNDEIFSPFSMKEIDEHREKYAAEARTKYGKTDAYKQSSARTASYTKEDWQRITAEGNHIFGEFAEIMEEPADSAAAFNLVEKWRGHISKNFYHCSIEFLAGLGATYVSDERFTRNIDKTKPGLALFMSRAIEAYCIEKRGS